MLCIYLLRPTAQHCLAADAAGAAPDLGVIVGHDGAPSLVPVGGGSPAAPLKAGVGPPNKSCHERESVSASQIQKKSGKADSEVVV